LIALVLLFFCLFMGIPMLGIILSSIVAQILTFKINFEI
jgi:hypothetical protein